jgi:hypothetical protein
MVSIELYHEDDPLESYNNYTLFKSESLSWIKIQELSDFIDIESLLNLDVVRDLVVRYLGSEYSDCKYKISTRSSFNDIIITVYFDFNLKINRDIKIKEILND